MKAETFGPQARLARLLICAVPRCTQPSVAAHVRSRGAGGKDKDVANLCAKHHEEQHRIGIVSFQEKHALNLEVVAGRLQEWVRDHDCLAWVLRGACAICETPCEGAI